MPSADEQSEGKKGIRRIMNKVAFITGSTRGIGKQISKTLAKDGYDIVINYMTEEDNYNDVIKEIENENPSIKCIAVKGDVTSFEDCENMVKEIVDKFGKIDVLVNNAGITRDMLLLRMKEKDFRDVIDVNLVGTFNLTKCASSYMIKAKSGRIINIASVVGIAGNSGQSNYAASKAGIIGFTKSIAKELASRNILVNAVAPGITKTDMVASLPEEMIAPLVKTIPLGRIGEPRDIANAFLFLASDLASYITGVVLSVDGAARS